MMRFFALLLTLGLAACQPQAEAPSSPEIEFLSTPEYLELGVPFSQAVRVGDLLFLAGQIGNLPGGLGLVEGGIEAEARQTMDNIKETVERFGTDMDHVVKCTVFLEDMADWPAFNEVYREYFTNYPARSAFGTDGLALGAQVEVECIAAMP